jgi:hypothetical protein
MPRRVNKYGLTDAIPAAVRRLIRQECGFGCVCCGRALVQYDHFDPPFDEATNHRVEGIALLCGSCHDKRNHRLLSAETVAARRRDPVTFRNGQARESLDLVAPLVVHLGSSSFRNLSSIVRTHDGDRWLAIDEPEAADAPARLYAKFHDDDGQLSLEIDGNEWRCFMDHWDNEVVGPLIRVHRSLRDVVLELVAEPPHGIRVVRLKMHKGGLAVDIDASGTITLVRGGAPLVVDACDISGSDAAIVL